ncbi:hypothetical protein BC835DRAFT_457653 [Cytidiella melzeri]|nr:hypothetical protein BC835DRAFT_457653 [Cytidiella melzeri]
MKKGGEQKNSACVEKGIWMRRRERTLFHSKDWQVARDGHGRVRHEAATSHMELRLWPGLPKQVYLFVRGVKYVWPRFLSEKLLGGQATGSYGTEAGRLTAKHGGSMRCRERIHPVTFVLVWEQRPLPENDRNARRCGRKVTKPQRPRTSDGYSYVQVSRSADATKGRKLASDTYSSTLVE